MQAQVGQHHSGTDAERQIMGPTTADGTSTLGTLVALVRVGGELLGHVLYQLPKLVRLNAQERLDEGRMIAQTLLGEHGNLLGLLVGK
jgi:hypothetical protein